MFRITTQEDQKRDFLILILIFEITRSLHTFEYSNFHKMVLHYIQELENSGMADLGFYIDIISGRSKEAEEGLFSAVAWGYLDCPSEQGRFRKMYSDRMKHRRLVRQTELTPDEWSIAEKAAKATYEAFLSGTLVEKQPATH